MQKLERAVFESRTLHILERPHLAFTLDSGQCTR
jgi:hypothetical protein